MFYRADAIAQKYSTCLAYVQFWGTQGEKENKGKE